MIHALPAFPPRVITRQQDGVHIRRFSPACLGTLRQWTSRTHVQYDHGSVAPRLNADASAASQAGRFHGRAPGHCRRNFGRRVFRGPRMSKTASAAARDPSDLFGGQSLPVVCGMVKANESVDDPFSALSLTATRGRASRRAADWGGPMTIGQAVPPILAADRSKSALYSIALVRSARPTKTEPNQGGSEAV